MSKELEALEELRDFRYGKDKLLVCQTQMYLTIKKALQRLEAIDNANPSEALEYLERVDDYVDKDYDYCQRGDYDKDYNTIKQALIKEQEQEKVLKIIFEKRIDMWHLVDLLDQTYEMYLAFCKSEKYEKDYILTEEEFDLLKEVLCDDTKNI